MCLNPVSALLLCGELSRPPAVGVTQKLVLLFQHYFICKLHSNCVNVGHRSG